jgi:hypothetical protein
LRRAVAPKKRCPCTWRRRKRKTFRERAYDSAWTRLSARARKLQPFCSFRGSTEDLTADHLIPVGKGGPTKNLTLGT